MADRLKMLSVEQLNNAVSFVGTVSSHEKINASANVAHPIPQCLPQGKTGTNAIINTGPVVISLNQKPTVLTRSINQQGFIPPANCLSLPVIAEDKRIIIGQPVKQLGHPIQRIQTIPAFTSCQIPSVVTIPTFTSSQMTSVVTTPSSIQQQHVQFQGGSLMQPGTNIGQNLSECLLSSNLSQTMLQSSNGSFIIAEDGTLQISNGVVSTSQNPVVVSSKVDLTGKNTCQAQQQQQPVIILASSNGNNGVMNNTAVADRSTPVLYEVLPIAGNPASLGNIQSICSTTSGIETIPVQSVSSNYVQALPSLKVFAGKSTVPTSSSVSLIDSQASQFSSPSGSLVYKASVTNSQHSLPTIVVKKTLRKCNNGTVLEMVERMQPVTNFQTPAATKSVDQQLECSLVTTGSYCVECDKMYSDKSEQCATHGESIIEVSDTPVLSRARMSLPGQLQLKQLSGSSANQVATFSRDALSKRTRFGPLVGKLLNVDGEMKEDLPMQWKIFNKGKVTQVRDCSLEESSNWLRFVRPANSNEEQNVVAYQQGQDIWFITLKDIPPETELMYWYSSEYSTLLGTRKKPSDFFKCGVCGKESQDFTKLQSHVTYVHSGLSQKKHQCQICARSFPGKTKLNTHVLGHLGVKPYVCSICGKQFSDQSNLRLHKDIHTGEKRFQCGQCGRSFRQKAHLVTHNLVHTGEKKLQCKFCEKPFARASDLRSHERAMHTKEKKYVCMVLNCHKVFHKLSVFKKHMLIHSNKKDFSCPTCTKTFITKYHLTRHAKTCKGGNKGRKVKDYASIKQGEDSSTDSAEVT